MILWYSTPQNTWYSFKIDFLSLDCETNNVNPHSGLTGKSYFCELQTRSFCQIMQNMTITYDNKVFILNPSHTFDRIEFSNVYIGFV